MSSTDLSEIARTEIQQIANDQHAAQLKANQKLDRSLRIFLVGNLIILMVNFAINRYFLPEQILSSPSVRLAVAPAEDNPLLCPGDILRYTLTLDIQEPAVVTVDFNIRNLDEKRIEIPSSTVRVIYDTPGTITLPASWIVPLRLPETVTRSERLWQPGQYRGLIAITAVEGDREASVISIDFRIAENCP